MKYIKLFEELNIKIQDPFYLTGDRLYVSNELAHKITPTLEYYMKPDNPGWAIYNDQKNKDFYAGTRSEKGYLYARKKYGKSNKGMQFTFNGKIISDC